jgi:C4-dicarboxylate-specific signal transduction histidine kinase
MHDKAPFAAAESSLVGGLTRHLNFRYALILIAIGLLLVLDQALLQPRLVQLSVVAPRINVAGRQRMLSQKLVKESLVLQSASDNSQREYRSKQLAQTVEEWHQSHLRLLSSDREVGLSTTSSSAVREAFAELELDFQAMWHAATDLLADQPGNTPIAELLQHESRYLPKMDRIVTLFEAEARAQAATLQTWGLVAAASVLALMVGLGFVVLRPATQTIQRQLEGLEQRIADRTAELTVINASLLHEMHTREHAEERNRELSTQLAHLSRVHSLGQLATGLAHEINQPLGAIANYSETCDLLLSRETPNLGAVRQTLAAVGKAARRAGDIIRNMRTFLRPGQQAHSDVNLCELINDVVQLCRPELLRQEVILELELEEGLPSVRLAAVQIQQVLMNLIQNSVQAMQDASPTERRLKISAWQARGAVRVEVADRGPGFGSRDPESLFEPFFTTKDSGLGMGLAIVRSIVQAHGGRVEAENRQPGAAVSFTMPLDLQDERRVAAEAHCLCG